MHEGRVVLAFGLLGLRCPMRCRLAPSVPGAFAIVLSASIAWAALGCDRSGSTSAASVEVPAPPASTASTAAARASSGIGTPETPAPPPLQVVEVFVLAKEAARAKGLAGAKAIGCDDVLVPRRVKITSVEPKARLREALEKLFGAMTDTEIGSDAVAPVAASSKISVAAISERDGTFFVDLGGTPSFGGVCAVPRFKSAIELTAAAHGKVVLALHGSTAAWKCLGDESGLCN